MANIREYNMNGILILGIDHGYGNIKTAHRVFPTALIKSEKAPTFSEDYLEYPKDVQIKNVKAITCAHLARINKIIEIFIKLCGNFKIL